MKFTLDCEQEVDGRWLAEVAQLPGVLAYGSSSNEAMAKAEVLALRVLAERVEHDSEELGPRMLARIPKHTGLEPEHL